MENIFVSIVIPTFNVPGELLERCLKSIAVQSFQEYEVILIDDGSDEFYKQIMINSSYVDNRIKLILNEHKGVSSARNVGINLAKGEYIAFVDADDVICDNFLVNAVQVAKDYDFPDIIIGGMEFVPFKKKNNTQYGRTIDIYQHDEIDVLKSSLMYIKDSRVKYHILGTPCGHMYKSSIAKDVKFPTSVSMFEDQVFNRRFLIKSNKAVVVPEMWYKYMLNQESVTHTIYKDLPYDLTIPYWDELLKIDSEENYSNKDGLRGYYIGLFFSLIGNYVYEDKKIVNQIIDKLLDHPLIKLAIKEVKLKSRISIKRKIELSVAKTNSKFLIRSLANILFLHKEHT